MACEKKKAKGVRGFLRGFSRMVLHWVAQRQQEDLENFVVIKFFGKMKLEFDKSSDNPKRDSFLRNCGKALIDSALE